MSEQHGVEIELDLDDDANPEPDEHRDILFQAAQEFLLNAVKHSGKKCAVLRLSAAEQQLWVTVEDNGLGFDPEVRLSRQESFGLFNVRQRLEVAGGLLRINSQPGRGTTASATLPTAVATAGNADAGLESITHPGPPLVGSEKIRVLIVDDHALVREGLRQILSKEPGMDVVAEASNGVEGVALASLLQPDVVVMDVRMPEMNGIEATKQIRSQLANVQVIGLSLDEAEETSKSMIEAGAAMFLTKSAAGDRLVGAIRSVVRRPC
jgi:CheY-like chemotaxis protein